MTGVFRHFFLIVCACLLGGTHWAVLQVGAWTSMAINPAGRGIAEWQEIVGGNKPCRLCHAIDAGRRQEQGDDRSFPIGGKVGFGTYCEVDQTRLPVELEAGVVEWIREDCRASARKVSPLTPPPRA
jgi:hypothetical protein